MRSQQSKLENRSTSSSDFFAKRYPDAQSYQYQPLQHGISSYFSSGISQQPSSVLQKSSKIIQQSSKAVNEYQMFQSSKQANQNLCQMKSSVKQISQEPKNPFLIRNFELGNKNKNDVIYENNFSKQTFGSTCKQVRFQNDLTKNQKIPEYEPLSKKYEISHGFQQHSEQKRSYSSHKQNIQPLGTKGLLSTQKTFNHSQLLQPVTSLKSSQLLQPVALNRCCSDKNVMPQMSISRFQETSIFEEPHRMLDHIYFTIAHESDLRDAFKQFAVSEQEKISQRFREMMMSLENTLNEIKISMDKRIDESYKTLLGQLDSIKSMAELMWKDKRSKAFSSSSYKNTEQMVKIARYSGITQNRERPGSRHGYYKFSQLQMRSPESNNLLLNQLLQQDQRMGEFKRTKRLYQNQSQYGNQLDRDKLLRQMHQVSVSIAKMMRQCQYGVLDVALQDKREKKKGVVWFADASSYNMCDQVYNNTEVDDVGESVRREISEISNLVEGFRASLKRNYAQR